MKSLASFLVLVVFASSSLWGQEPLLLQPPGLEPGDQYRLMFLTSRSRDATSPDIDVYNAFVQQVADDAPVVGSWGLHWSVVGSTEAVNARANTDTDDGDGTNGFGVPIYRLDGVLLVSDYRGLWQAADFGSAVPGGTNYTELGTRLEPQPKWNNFGVVAFTGTEIGGGAGPDSRYLGGENAQVGTTFHAANFDWFGVGGSPRSTNEVPFYAMSNVITAVPEPTSHLNALFGLVMPMKRRHRH